MVFKIIWTDSALRNLEGIVRHIAQDNAVAAAEIGERIVDHVSILADFPEIGPVYRHRRNGLIRQITSRPFRIFFRVRRKEKIVEILTIWHGARDEPVML